VDVLYHLLLIQFPGVAKLVASWLLQGPVLEPFSEWGTMPKDS